MSKSTLSQILSDFTENPALKGASTSALFFDLITDEVLDSHNKDLKLCPASTWKVLSAAAAAQFIENEKPFRTDLLLRGKIEDGTLKGDIIIRGYGDPSLGSEVFYENQMQILDQWSDWIRKTGIRRIDGKIIADDTWLEGISLPRTRIWEDMANYYGTHISGLNFHDNAYTVKFDTRVDPGERVRLLGYMPEVPDLNLSNYVVASTIRSDQAFIFGSPLSANRTIRGTLPAGYDSYEIQGGLPDPAVFCAFHLQRKLKEIGIQSEGISKLRTPIKEPTQLLGTIHSHSLEKIIEEVLIASNNLYAEALTAKLGQVNGNGNLEAGVERIQEFYSKHCDSGSQIHAYDGSGLSRFNAISAQQFQHILSHCNKNQNLKKLILSNLPRFGETGTVKRMGKEAPLKGNVAAKSGSMTGVLAYVGTLNTISGRQVGFAILINNFEQPAYQIRQTLENLFLKVYEKY